MTVEIATEALTDTYALVFDPDPRSRSRISVRVIGYSDTLGHIVAVLLVPNDDGDGWYGATGHMANGRERRLYAEQIEGDETDG